eukprot:TRINITY_DN6743_c0_g1_i2.p1 TRINITY_DN6743_c0_g1~~TRINITY_DN6743_c0_g1_i2.p1  ORF type:complete len:325 (-),score=67.71 TRINITY_DN6743_c0_g1_i2:186-1160(-)
MGCKGSKGAKAAGSKAGQGVSLKAAEKAERKKLNPADYIFSKKTGAVLVKEEGSINGEQFNIEECKDCDIFLLDTIATAFIDECENCRIYVGPVESSVMVRNCKNCSFIMACQQFRSRDCNDCRLALYCGTEPIIETSLNMQFACFDFFYFSLREQLSKAGLRLWNNKWSQIYDFNKNPDKPNWSLLPQEQAVGLVDVDKCPSISKEEVCMDRVVPVTLGSRKRPSQESCFAVFLPNSDDAAVEALVTKASKDGWSLCQMRCTVHVFWRRVSRSFFLGRTRVDHDRLGRRGQEYSPDSTRSDAGPREGFFRDVEGCHLRGHACA